MIKEQDSYITEYNSIFDTNTIIKLFSKVFSQSGYIGQVYFHNVIA